VVDSQEANLVQTVTFSESGDYEKPDDYSQTLAGDYSFDCEVTDGFGGTNSYVFTVTVATNDGVEAIDTDITASIDN